MSGLDDDQKQIFQFFNEVAIISQLSTTLMNRQLPDGLHLSHFGVLNHLTRLGDGKTPLSIANAFQVTKGNMTNTLTKLSNKGYIRLAPHAKDGRSKLVFMTDEGRVFHKHAMESLMPTIEKLSGKLNVEAMMKMVPDLAAVRQVLDENRED